jgi:ketosteroid isomerase-like protein
MEHSSGETAIAQAVEDYRNGLVSANAAKLATLCMEELTYGHVHGLLQTKAEFVADVVSRRITWKSLDFENVTNHIVGDCAISRLIYIAENESGGAPHSSRFQVIMVWCRQDGQWKLLARQAFKV